MTNPVQPLVKSEEPHVEEPHRFSSDTALTAQQVLKFLDNPLPIPTKKKFSDATIKKAEQIKDEFAATYKIITTNVRAREKKETKEIPLDLPRKVLTRSFSEGTIGKQDEMASYLYKSKLLHGSEIHTDLEKLLTEKTPEEISNILYQVLKQFPNCPQGKRESAVAQFNNAIQTLLSVKDDRLSKRLIVISFLWEKLDSHEDLVSEIEWLNAKQNILEAICNKRVKMDSDKEEKDQSLLILEMLLSIELPKEKLDFTFLRGNSLLCSVLTYFITKELKIFDSLIEKIYKNKTNELFMQNCVKEFYNTLKMNIDLFKPVCSMSYSEIMKFLNKKKLGISEEKRFGLIGINAFFFFRGVCQYIPKKMLKLEREQQESTPTSPTKRSLWSKIFGHTSQEPLQESSQKKYGLFPDIIAKIANSMEFVDESKIQYNQLIKESYSTHQEILQELIKT
ncbi:MAG: hypothetical protein L0207_05845 [Chlamydiae bacterium]|nr:hypothetical protein [Chlamydiota bacterium]